MTVGDELNRIKSTMSILGINPQNGKHSFLTRIIALVPFILILNTACYVIFEWDNLDRRIDGLKAISQCLLCFLYLLVLLFKWDEITLILKTIENAHFRFPYQPSKKRCNLLSSKQKTAVNISRFWYSALTLCPVFGLLIPILYLMLTVLKKDLKDVDINELLLLYPFYFPKNYKTFPVYLFAYGLENLFLLTASLYGYILVVGTFISMQTIESELELLRLSIIEMDDIISMNGILIGGKEYSMKRNNIAIEYFIKYFVQHHQSIHRKVSDVNKGIQKFAVIIHAIISLYMCMTIYLIIKKKRDTLSQIQEIFMCSLMSFHMFCHDFLGERIATSSENLRTSLYECSWIDKPEWFKKYLHIALILSNKRIVMKPAGLFELNLRHFAMSVNAAYSYYNLLKNLG